ncbi:MAG: proprotein convertase P-domain-containing protein [Oligoflexales bacterium]
MRKSSLGLLWAISSTAMGFVAPSKLTSKHSSLPEQNEYVLRISTSGAYTPWEKDPSILIREDSLNQQPRVMVGESLAFSPSRRLKDFTNTAESFLESHASLFGTNPSSLKLDTNSILSTSKVTTFRYHVYRGEYLIQDAEVVFRFRGTQLSQVINHTFSEVTTPSFDRKSNLNETAQKIMSGFSILANNQPRLRVVATSAGYTMVPIEEYKSQTKDGHNYTLQLDSQTGKVFEFQDSRLFHNGSAKIDTYPRWYTDDIGGRAYSSGKVRLTNGQQVSTNRNGQFSAGESEPSLQGLKGSHTQILNSSGSEVGVSASFLEGEWDLHLKHEARDQPWKDPITAQSMAYHHIDDIVTYAKQWIPNEDWFNRPLTANVNLNSYCNAYWNGDSVNFFSGNNDCANTALISDVIFHEWGHGLDDNTGGIEDRAFSEGYGDIISLIRTHSPVLGIGFLLPDYGSVRDLRDDKKYPDDRGEEHSEGLIIGSTFWDLFESLENLYGAEKTEKILAKYAFQMIYSARTYLDVYDAVLFLDDNDSDLTNGTPHQCLLNSVFEKHGLADADLTCQFAGLSSPQVEDKGGDNDGIAEPGEWVSLAPFLENRTNNTLRDLTGLVHTSSPAVESVENEMVWESVAPHTKKKPNEKAKIRISSQAVCGSKISGNIQLQGGIRVLFQPFNIQVGQEKGFFESWSATNLPKKIRDMSTLETPITVEGEQWDSNPTVQTLKVNASINHTYPRDLSIKLVSPQGQQLVLFSGNGGSRNSVKIQRTFDLSDKSMTGRGQWKLLTTDQARRDEGTLESFSMTAKPSLFVCE